MGLESFLPSGNEKLDSLLRFSAEIDKMTSVIRRTVHVDGSGRENDAEHSWHIALMSLLFYDFALEKVDVSHAAKLCLTHDLVEIYAGDTFAYDKSGNETKKEREKNAADRLFSLLPNELGFSLRSLWEEFEEGKTAEAKYALCLDRLQPLLHNSLTGGRTWKENKTLRADVESHTKIIHDFMPEAYKWIEQNLDRAQQNGWLT